MYAVANCKARGSENKCRCFSVSKGKDDMCYMSLKI